jgi:hypothetical protein
MDRQRDNIRQEHRLFREMWVHSSSAVKDEDEVVIV